MGAMINVYSNFFGEREGKRPFGRPRHKWGDNIGMDPREIGWKVVEWMHLVQDRDQWQTLVDTIMKFRVP
jgi:hypothetical protein